MAAAHLGLDRADHPATRLYWALAGRARGRTNERGMRETLERIKAVAENG